MVGLILKQLSFGRLIEVCVKHLQQYRQSFEYPVKCRQELETKVT